MMQEVQSMMMKQIAHLQTNVQDLIAELRDVKKVNDVQQRVIESLVRDIRLLNDSQSQQQQAGFIASNRSPIQQQQLRISDVGGSGGGLPPPSVLASFSPNQPRSASPDQPSRDNRDRDDTVTSSPYASPPVDESSSLPDSTPNCGGVMRGKDNMNHQRYHPYTSYPAQGQQQEDEKRRMNFVLPVPRLGEEGGWGSRGMSSQQGGWGR